MTALLDRPPTKPDIDVGDLELSVVMPCLNEERTLPVCIGKALDTMRQHGIRGEVVIVDNGSTDRSVVVAREHGARVVHQPLKGYGNALRKGFAEARGRFIIMGDCDDSYDFRDIPRFVERLRGGAELVMGNRLHREGIKPKAMPWLHQRIGNPGLTWFLNVLFRTNSGDVYCGMRGMRKDAVERMNLQMPGMELAPEMVIKSTLAGLKVDEIPITLWPDGRDRKPHLRSFRDGWRGLRFMLMCSPTALFVLPGLFLTIFGILAIPTVMLAGYGTYQTFFSPNFLFGCSVLAVCGWHLLLFGFLAKLHAHHVDPVFRDERIERLAAGFTVDRGLITGLVLLAASAAFGVPVLVHWFRTFTLPLPGQWILAGTLFLIGFETMFASFLVGILDLRRESRRTG
jgi:glycosyltransferase involved in cell wall biosynthesis